MPDGQPDPVARFFGGALLAIGFLMMALCGGCGAVFLLFYLVDGLAHPNDLPLALFPVALGGVPALIGFGLFAWGRSLRREPAKAATPDG
jgi:hypothetical protein